jgi:hypothetical protein
MALLKHVGRLERETEQSGESGSTIHGWTVAVGGVLGAAVREGCVPSNPAPGLDKDDCPSLRSRKERILDDDEVALLLDHADRAATRGEGWLALPSPKQLYCWRCQSVATLAEVQSGLTSGGRRFDPVTAHVEAAEVSLRRWLRRQLRQPTPLREHLEAAVENNDPAEARRLVDRFEFSDAQRRNVEQLLEAWERTLGRTGR